MKERIYAAVDLKSFYASVECVERGLDPLSTNLVVADQTRTEKTICLAVSPSLKSYGVASRPRLFEVISSVAYANSLRRWSAPGRRFKGASFDDKLLRADAGYEIAYIIAPPRMALYIEYSRRIYATYLRYFAPEDIHVYSIDEVFIDITAYLSLYKLTPRELMMRVVRDVLSRTGITATVGIGTNLYLAKVAMDIVAKKLKADRDGVRIAELDVMSYRNLLWSHTPLTDFWRVGRGYERRLVSHGMRTMGDIALMSEKNEDLLYKLFGVNAELLIDHAWGYESCTMENIKAYRPLSSSVSTGQVLSRPYENAEAKMILREMCEALSLDLLEKGLVTNQITLTVGYDISSTGDVGAEDIDYDFYGRGVPRHAHGSQGLYEHTSSLEAITDAALSIFCREADARLAVRRIILCASNVCVGSGRGECEQISLFDEEISADSGRRLRESKIMRAQSDIRKRFGKNALIRGTSLENGATMIERNTQIGGHKA